MFTVSKLFSAAVLGLSLVPFAAQADMLAVTFGGAVYDVDSASGSAQLLQPAGPSFNSLASDGSSFWSVEFFDGRQAQGRLAKIDATGVATLGPAITGLSSEISIRGLAFAGGSLYAIQNTINAGALAPDSLYRIDTTTGAATLVGATLYSGVQALAADSSGRLWGWDTGSGLLQIDVNTGAATRIGTGGGFYIQTLAFSPTGVLYGAHNDLYTVDTSTGVATFASTIGVPGGADIRGMDFMTAAPIPEPGTWGLMALGLVAVGSLKRQRRA